MAGINEIKKSVLLENDVFTQWKEDLNEFEESYLYARELAEMMLGAGGEEGFADFGNGKFARNNLPTSVNTYPFGTKTNDVFSEFIGVCEGDQKLNGLFKTIEKQVGYYMSPNYVGRDRKAITIFTDKWDPKFLDKYEPLFLQAILENNVYFNFYLVTDYGITRIPFMNREQVEKFKRDFRGETIEEAMTLEEVVDKENIFEVIYTANQYDSWIPQTEQVNYKYEFDFRNLRYFFEDNKGETEQGKINKSYALRFIRAAIALRNAGGLNSQSRTTNYMERNVDFGRFSFGWFDNTGVEDDLNVANMVDSLMDMVSTLK